MQETVINETGRLFLTLSLRSLADWSAGDVTRFVAAIEAARAFQSKPTPGNCGAAIRALLELVPQLHADALPACEQLFSVLTRAGDIPRQFGQRIAEVMGEARARAEAVAIVVEQAAGAKGGKAP
jgi:hypothetical protein